MRQKEMPEMLAIVLISNTFHLCRDTTTGSNVLPRYPPRRVRDH